LAVDGCPCGGVFVWTPLLETRLPDLCADDRATLSSLIRSLRNTGREVWLRTSDDTPGGTLDIRRERPGLEA
jgi:hypothetical protein